MESRIHIYLFAPPAADDTTVIAVQGHLRQVGRDKHGILATGTNLQPFDGSLDRLFVEFIDSHLLVGISIECVFAGHGWHDDFGGS